LYIKKRRAALSTTLTENKPRARRPHQWRGGGLVYFEIHVLASSALLFVIFIFVFFWLPRGLAGVGGEDGLRQG